MKYFKPLARNLGAIPNAQGYCYNGSSADQNPDTDCTSGGVALGAICSYGGTPASQACDTGGIPVYFGCIDGTRAVSPPGCIPGTTPR